MSTDDPGTEEESENVTESLLTAGEILRRKWDAHLIDAIGPGTAKFSDIQKATEDVFEENADGVSSKVLSDRLDDLEEAGVVDREVSGGKPVEIEYSLTEAGEAFRDDVIAAAVEVGREHLRVTEEFETEVEEQQSV